MLKEEYLNRIVEKSPINFYLSANDGARVYIPGRMQPPHESSQRYVNQCNSYFIDSAFSREDIGNREVLKTATKLNADKIVLEDVYQDLEGTVEKVNEGKELAEKHRFAGEIYHPIQEPYIECWERIGKPKKVCIGGLKNGSHSRRIEVVQSLREESKKSLTIHGLGWGLYNDMIRSIRNDPALIDSIDARTPWSSARNDVSNVWNKPEDSHKSEICTIYSMEMAKNILKALRRTIPEYTLLPSEESKKQEETTPEGYCSNPQIDHTGTCENCGNTFD